MKLREKIFLIELFIFLFLALGIAGNSDLGIEMPLRCYIELFVSMSLTFFQAKYIEIKDRKEEKKCK